jgi:hypothetical protein
MAIIQLTSNLWRKNLTVRRSDMRISSLRILKRTLLTGLRTIAMLLRIPLWCRRLWSQFSKRSGPRSSLSSAHTVMKNRQVLGRTATLRSLGRPTLRKFRIKWNSRRGSRKVAQGKAPQPNQEMTPWMRRPVILKKILQKHQQENNRIHLNRYLSQRAQFITTSEEMMSLMKKTRRTTRVVPRKSSLPNK